jgi:lysophospholipase L1-like esterase
MEAVSAMRRLVCFGDSNTYGFDPRSFSGDRYGSALRWTGCLTGWTVVNAGMNGRTIPKTDEADALWALCGPSGILTVMLGSNDLLQDPSCTAEDTADKMEAFLRQLLTRFSPVQLLLIAPPPMRLGAWVCEDRLVAESAGLAASYAAVACRLGIHFADAGTWNVALCFDGVHFSPEGHRAFAQGLQRALALL